MNTKKHTVSLVLGSGGARGLAHIGIIEWLNENGFDIHSISGSSMGALIGGLGTALLGIGIAHKVEKAGTTPK